MFLKLLKIEYNDALVREINFHKGINLIVDETKTASKKESGNNVGKTTVLRLIDYCLGGSGENIYRDAEFNQNRNIEIESYLKDNRVIVTLLLVDNIDHPLEEISIRRNFLSRKNKLIEINGERYKDEKALGKELKMRIFHSEEEKPTFRQIISKNIRDEKNRLQNTLKVLHATTTRDVYEPLFLFWLGIELEPGNHKDKLNRDRKVEENLQSRLKSEGTLSMIDQSLIVIERSIQELTARKESFNLNPSFESDLAELNQVKFDLNRLSTELSRWELRKELKKNGATDDLQTIITDLNSEFEKKGRNEELKRLWHQSLMNMSEIDKQLSHINEELISKDELIQKRVSIFNKYFSSITNKLYGEREILSANPTDTGYEFLITPVAGNPGTGKKKGQIAAFDLAYIQFADDLGIKCLHFVLNDQIENIHDNQINNLLLEIVSETNCQYILPVLRDKLPEDIDIDEYEVLTLSQFDKLFKI